MLGLMARTDFRACVSNSTFVFRVQCSDQNLQPQLNCVRMVAVILIHQLKVVHMQLMHGFLVWAYQK
jgi:hypothetical protein